MKDLPLDNTAVFEVKMVKGKRFALNTVHQHQIDGLLGALEGLYMRIPDIPWGNGMIAMKKPFDCLWLKNAEAYVVPVFYIPRKKKMAYFIPIQDFLKLEGKSVTEEQLSHFLSMPL